MSKIVAILTDFGNKDAYSGIMKGVLLNINKNIFPVDLSNEIEPFNVLSASFLLYSSFDYFPKGTIFLIVVDPGVGSVRNEITGIIDGKYLVCPDNGILSLLLKTKKNGSFYKINKNEIIKITKKEISPTFHGRDIFAPACGIISKGGFKKICAEKINPLILKTFDNKILKNKITGNIIHIDIYGNCITSIYKNEIINNRFNNIKINNKKINAISKYYNQVKTQQPLAYLGSSGFLEIAIREDNAAKTLEIKQNDIIKLF